MKKIKCLYFFDQTSFEGDIIFLSFCDFMKIPETPLTSHKMSKSSYLPQMMSNPKNKGTLFSLTLKVEEGKVLSFSWSEFILVSNGYCYFVVSWDTGKPLRSHKMTKGSYLPQMTPNPKNKGTLFSSTFKVEDRKVGLFLKLEANSVRYCDFEILQFYPF